MELERCGSNEVHHGKCSHSVLTCLWEVPVLPTESPSPPSPPADPSCRSSPAESELSLQPVQSMMGKRSQSSNTENMADEPGLQPVGLSACFYIRHEDFIHLTFKKKSSVSGLYQEVRAGSRLK